MDQYVLGISGGPDTINQQIFQITADFTPHDGAAVLIKNGVVVAAVEEERLDRIKHSSLFPAEAIKFCLRKAGISVSQLEKIAFYVNENYVDGLLNAYHAHSGGHGGPLRAKDLISARIGEIYGTFVPDLGQKLVFVDHHVAHAYSAFPYSESDENLVVVIDAAGEFSSGLIGTSKNGQLEIHAHLSLAQSLGNFYLKVIEFMGFKVFEEYKVMGLAPYGDPAIYRSLFQEFYTLKENGQFEFVDFAKITEKLLSRLPIVERRDDIETCHHDLAASLQESLEAIVFHILRYWRMKTGIEHLSLAGGVAHNCTMNGKILESGLFKTVFVQPAAHDAGCALGAANFAAMKGDSTLKLSPFANTYWGPTLPDSLDIEKQLSKWSEWLDFKKSEAIVAETARHLAEGDVVGWVQGASEFGPRALGNRSIIADPRPSSNRERINFMIKKREGFRPFAPSVTLEAASTYFDLMGAEALPFMSFVVKVRPEHRADLGAITHVDGTARVQTVTEESNPRYWNLLNAFGTATGVPMLLNTSFNNNVEPVVDSVLDAIVCFLTTGLDRLVIGDFIAVQRKGSFHEKLRNAHIRLMPYAKLWADSSGAVVKSDLTGKTVSISPLIENLLSASTHNKLTIGKALANSMAQKEEWGQELLMLWERRLVQIEPGSQGNSL